MSEIIVDNITVSYGEKIVLRDLSLHFPIGRVTTVMGPSGCGKTSLLYVLAGLNTPVSGSVTGVEGKLAFLFQEDRLCPDFSVLSNIRMVTGKKVPEKEIREHLKTLGLEDNIRQKVGILSGGMKRRVAIARAVCCAPDILLLDEPFKGLDGELRRTTADYILERMKGKTVICVTHDQTEAEYMGTNHIALSRNG